MYKQSAQRPLAASSPAPVKGQRPRPVTMGFPAQRKPETKRVHFDPPLRARFVAPDESEYTSCEVTSVWETGARLRMKHPPPARFTLQFAWSPTVVSRFCRRVHCRGADVWV